jgi:acyl-CoA reductase-like NAD-dependent aldehyde dehydrogenase
MGIFPPGVLQVLSGGDDLGPVVTEHPDIDKLTFTGSSETGKLVMQNRAKTLKRVTLELGGNDAAIICEDVDIDAIVPKIATLAFLNSGQICMLIKQLYVHESIYDDFALPSSPSPRVSRPETGLRLMSSSVRFRTPCSEFKSLRLR